MKLTRFLGLSGAFAALVGLMSSIGKADSGREAAARTERGSYIETRSVDVSSTTGTALFAASVLRPDGLCRNNSASTVWVGTTSATTNNAIHSNILIGFPVLSSETFKLDGQMTGVVYGTSGQGLGTLNLRCVDGLVR